MLSVKKMLAVTKQYVARRWPLYLLGAFIVSQHTVFAQRKHIADLQKSLDLYRTNLQVPIDRGSALSAVVVLGQQRELARALKEVAEAISERYVSDLYDECRALRTTNPPQFQKCEDVKRLVGYFRINW